MVEGDGSGMSGWGGSGVVAELFYWEELREYY